ncbi:MAG: cytochrome P450, partial [Planctomycetales bacterium]|nr:cytochrome P450 [Planctomycetales bacterium]
MAKSTSTALPPGPPGRWRPTLRLIHDARGAFREWSQKYGDPFYLHALNGPVVITGRPELIKQIFSHDPLAYDAFAERALRPMLGSGSLLLLNGERHRRERKLVMPLFHGDRMRSYAAIMQQAALDAMENRPQNTAFDMLDATTEISLSVIVQAVFGGEQAEATRRMIDLAQATVRRSLPIFFFSPKLHIKFFGLSPWDKFLRSRADLRSALQAELRRRKEQPAEREDILSLMTEAQYEDGSPIALDDALDELGTFLFAGHETSAIALAWAIYHLHHNPPTLQRLEQELQAAGEVTGETLAKLPYLKAVVQETLRLHPIVTEV